MECGKTPRHLRCRWQTVRAEAMQPSGQLQQPDVTGSPFLFRLFRALPAGVESVAFIERVRITAGFARNIFPPYDLFCVRYSPWLFAIHPEPSVAMDVGSGEAEINEPVGRNGTRRRVQIVDRLSRAHQSRPDFAFSARFGRRLVPSTAGSGQNRSLAPRLETCRKRAENRPIAFRADNNPIVVKQACHLIAGFV